MNEIATLAGQFGAPGLLIGFMIWDRVQQNRLTEKRIEADKALAVSMTIIAERIK